jgi:DNA-binding NtrC family response regulator
MEPLRSLSSTLTSALPPAAAPEPVLLDPAMCRLYELAARVARGTLGVLVTGETGAGKEVLAEFLHQRSPRRAAPLVQVNCAALTDSLLESELFGHQRGAFTGAAGERVGLIEAADGGTVFLDEVGELSAPAQAKLLRVVEDRRVVRVGSSSGRPVDVRFVAATNRDLESEVAAGRFRRDLYFRIAGAVLRIPPLRERPGEIEALARSFLAQSAARLGVTLRLADDALRAARAHRWPGNVRELRNVIERAALTVCGDEVGAADLGLGGPTDGVPDASAPTASASDAGAATDHTAPPLRLALAAIERAQIAAALDRCGGNQTRAAALLGIPRRTLVKRLASFGLRRPRDAP